MALTPEQEAFVASLFSKTQKIISQLESEASINGNELLPVEDGVGSYAASINQLKSFINDSIVTSKINLSSPTELTISSGEVTIAKSNHIIDTEGDASSDDLDTINGGVEGDTITISIADNSRVVNLKHGTGNIVITSGQDIEISNINRRVNLYYNGTNWIVQDVKNVGDIVQVVNYQTGAVASGSTPIPDDDTPPNNTEGDQYMSLAIKPRNSSNKLLIDALCHGFCSVNVPVVAALFQDSGSNAIACGAEGVNAGVNVYPGIVLKWSMVAGTISSTTFKVRAGGSAGTYTFNGIYGSRKLGGKLISSITIIEIQQ